MSVGFIILLVLLGLSVAAAPQWQHGRGWGYGPSAMLGLLFVAMLVLMLGHRMSL